MLSTCELHCTYMYMYDSSMYMYIAMPPPFEEYWKGGLQTTQTSSPFLCLYARINVVIIATNVSEFVLGNLERGIHTSAIPSNKRYAKRLRVAQNMELS